MENNFSHKNYKTDEFTFGKYKGQKIEDITDIDYLKWAIENLDDSDETTFEFIQNIDSHLIERKFNIVE